MGGLVDRKVVAVAKGIEVAAGEREEAQLPVQGVEFVQIEREEKYAIHEPVRLGRKPGVHDMALVEAGIHYGDSYVQPGWWDAVRWTLSLAFLQQPGSI